MKAGLAVVLGIFVSVVAVLGFSYISASNRGNRSEQDINAAYENNQNILAQYGQKVQEAAGVTTLQRDDLIAVFTGANESRYGKTGSAATIQWIQEQNPTLDQATYIKVQQIIEAGRNEFQAAQTRLVDSKRSYRTSLGNFWGGMWLGVAGYPRIKIGYPIGSEDAYPVISTGRAQDAFKTGKEDGPIKLR
jgi:hypothetical protein